MRLSSVLLVVIAGCGTGAGLDAAVDSASVADSGQVTDTQPVTDTRLPADAPRDTFTQPDTGCADQDGDGFGVGATCRGPDCDDTNATVNLGEQPHCDGLDHDCDGDIDSLDVDGDGSRSGPGCAANDCDDSNAAIRPGAVEACDGVDSNCDGDADVMDARSLDDECLALASGGEAGWEYPPQCIAPNETRPEYEPRTKSVCQACRDRDGGSPLCACWLDSNSVGLCSLFP